MEAIFSFIQQFLKKYLSFWVFQSVPDFVDNFAKIVDEPGRNPMCNRTLPSLLVGLIILKHY